MAHPLRLPQVAPPPILHGYLLNAKGYDLTDPQVSFLSNLLRLSQSAGRLDPCPGPRSTNPLIQDAATLHSLSKTHAAALALPDSAADRTPPEVLTAKAPSNSPPPSPVRPRPRSKTSKRR